VDSGSVRLWSHRGGGGIGSNIVGNFVGAPGVAGCFLFSRYGGVACRHWRRFAQDQPGKAAIIARKRQREEREAKEKREEGIRKRERALRYI
jgi:hypothetical protein